MPRAQTKQDLLTSAGEQYKKLRTLVDKMSTEEQTAAFLFEDRDKNLRDIFVHLYEWHQLLLNWVSANINGEDKPFLLPPYTWKTYPQMNVDFWEKHQNTPYEKSKEMLSDSHKKVLALIEGFSDEELFTKQHFKWTGTTSLGQYCISATAAHYDWAMKKIKKHISTYKK